MSMQIELRLPQGDIDAEVVCLNANGQEVKVSKILVRPIFHQPQQRVPILYLTTLLEGDTGQGDAVDKEEVQRCLLQLSGTSGKLLLVDRSRQVVPQFAAKKRPKKGKDESSKPAPASPSSRSEGKPPIETVELPDEPRNARKHG